MLKNLQNIPMFILTKTEEPASTCFLVMENSETNLTTLLQRFASLGINSYINLPDDPSFRHDPENNLLIIAEKQANLLEVYPLRYEISAVDLEDWIIQSVLFIKSKTKAEIVAQVGNVTTVDFIQNICSFDLAPLPHKAFMEKYYAKIN
jgi:hypothetical protein